MLTPKLALASISASHIMVIVFKVAGLLSSYAFATWLFHIFHRLDIGNLDAIWFFEVVVRDPE